MVRFSVKSIPTPHSTQVKTVLFEIAELTAASHTILVETTGRKNPAAKAGWVWVDAFEFQ